MRLTRERHHREGPAFLWPLRVYYEDTDHAGIVYYANYLKFMERARTEWLRSLGVAQTELREDYGLVFAVASVQADFIRPARFDDRLEVGVNITRRGRVSIDLDQPVSRAGGELLCRGAVRIACLDAAEFTPRALPSGLNLEIGA